MEERRGGGDLSLANCFVISQPPLAHCGLGLGFSLLSAGCGEWGPLRWGMYNEPTMGISFSRVMTFSRRQLGIAKLC